MDIIDLSHPLHELAPCYPGDPAFKMEPVLFIPLSTDPAMIIRLHALSLSTHTGTHMDAPFHFFPSGKKLHEIPLAQFIGRAVILDVRHLGQSRAMISWADVTSGGPVLKKAISHIGSRSEGKADIVLLWTGWDAHWATPTYFAHPYFARDVAEALYDLGAKIVGVDVANPDETPPDEHTEAKHGWGMHETLLGRGVLICENLTGLERLVGEEETWVSLAPLNIRDADGAPVRAYGWKQPL